MTENNNIVREAEQNFREAQVAVTRAQVDLLAARIQGAAKIKALNSELSGDDETARLLRNPHTVEKLRQAEENIDGSHSVAVNWAGQFLDVGMRVGTIQGSGISGERKIGRIRALRFEPTEAAQVDWTDIGRGYPDNVHAAPTDPDRLNHVWIHTNNLLVLA